MSTKIQITITEEERDLLSQKAAKLGYDVTKFAKFILSREAHDQLKFSKRTEARIKQASKDYKQGKTRVLDSAADIDAFMDDLGDEAASK